MPDDADRISADDSLEPLSAGDVDESVVESTQTTGSRRWYMSSIRHHRGLGDHCARAVASALVSMVHELRGQAIDSVYDLFTGTAVDVDQTFGPNTAFVNITVTNLDEPSRTATLIVSGHRVCGAICPPTTSTFFSLGNDAAERRGLPPSAAVTVPGESEPTRLPSSFLFVVRHSSIHSTPTRCFWAW